MQETAIKCPPFFTVEECKELEGDKYVVLPHYVCSVSESENQQIANRPDWCKMVEILKRKITNGEELKTAFSEISGTDIQNGYFERILDVNSSSPTTRQFYDTTLPFIQSLTLRLPELFPNHPDHKISLLRSGFSKSFTLTQEQCACLLAASFTYTLWIKPEWFCTESFSKLEMDEFFCAFLNPKKSLFDCILNYFYMISQNMPSNKLTFYRQTLPQDIPNWSQSDKKIKKIIVNDLKSIEDIVSASLHVDFANQFIGGGVFHGGCVQEEKLFCCKPECLISMLFTSKIQDSDVFFIIGAETYSILKGKGPFLKFDKSYKDKSDPKISIVAMDALVAYETNQWLLVNILRDLNKAWLGFKPPFKNDEGDLEVLNGSVATGNWGTGAFGGDKSLKAFQQIMAASQNDRDVVYCTFKEKYKNSNKFLCDYLTEFSQICDEKNLKVSDLWEVIEKYLDQSASRSSTNLFDLFFEIYK